VIGAFIVQSPSASRVCDAGSFAGPGSAPGPLPVLMIGADSMSATNPQVARDAEKAEYPIERIAPHIPAAKTRVGTLLRRPIDPRWIHGRKRKKL
jgi:hypothetical protein